MVKDRGPGDGAGRSEFEPHYDGEKTTGADAWAQKRRLAQAMRLVIERLVPSNAPEEELRIGRPTGLEQYAEALKAHPRLQRMHGHAESATSGDVGCLLRPESPDRPGKPPCSAHHHRADGREHGGGHRHVRLGVRRPARLGTRRLRSGGLRRGAGLRPGPLGQRRLHRYAHDQVPEADAVAHGALLRGADQPNLPAASSSPMASSMRATFFAPRAEGIFISVDEERYLELMKKREAYEARLSESGD